MKNQNFLNISIKRNDSGITLIALAITIVLLLILAGVSINTLTGNNGTINRATSIKENKEKQDVKSKIDLAVTSSLYDGLETDDIDLDTLEEELVKDSINIISKDTEDALPWIVEENGKKFKIKPDGTVIEKVSVKILDEDGEEHLVEEEDVSDWYGKEVSNYTKGGTYRIFYIDFDGDFGDIGSIYLKADHDNSRYTACSIQYESNTLVRIMNPEWAKYRGNIESSWNANEKASAWLCSPTNELNEDTGIWKDYFEKEKANYVIGSPSLDMYVKSYNNVTSHTKKLDYSYSEKSSYGYRFKPTNDSVLDNGYGRWTKAGTLLKDLSGMYCVDKKYFWLASPSAFASNRVCEVDGDGAGLNGYLYNINYGICPIISLKSAFIPQISED